jgi:hypothetical protein
MDKLAIPMFKKTFGLMILWGYTIQNIEEYHTPLGNPFILTNEYQGTE